MRRPWELAHMRRESLLPAGGPLVYVPVSLPDATSSSAFAVLELLGFSSSPSGLSPSLSTSPLQAAATLRHSQQLHLSTLRQSSDAPNPAIIPTESCSITSLTESSTTCLDQVSSIATKRKIDTAHTSIAAAHEIDAAHTGIDAALPHVAVKSTVSDGRVYAVQSQIIENVVHATTSNFKHVVQQLTGAHSNGKEASPSSTAMPNPNSKAVASRALNALSAKVAAGKGFKKSPSKLQERRKKQCNLERLCSNKCLAVSISPLSPSPVTPLAPYFNSLGAAITPTSSDSSGHSSGVPSPEASLPVSNSSNTSINVPHTAITAEHCKSLEGEQTILSKLQHHVSVKETVSGPALLSLFPESPL